MAPFLADPKVGVLVVTVVAAVFAPLRFFDFFGALIGVLVVAVAAALALLGFFDFAVVRLLPDPTAWVLADVVPLLGGLFEYFTAALFDFFRRPTVSLPSSSGASCCYCWCSSLPWSQRFCNTVFIAAGCNSRGA